MPIVGKLDELGKPAWIALMILGFAVWWPFGLATLAFIIGSGRMGCSHHGHWENKMQRMQDKMDRVRVKMNTVGGGNMWGGPPSSGNRAFDEWREAELARRGNGRGNSGGDGHSQV